MSRKGNCLDNAVAESFFKTLKTEQIYGNTLISKKQMERDIFEIIEIWYNRKRRHSNLDYKIIKEFWKQKNNFNQPFRKPQNLSCKLPQKQISINTFPFSHPLLLIASCLAKTGW